MFLDENFLLTNEYSRFLFHNYAEDEAIIDYHCHLDPREIYENKNYDNITQIWLNNNGAGDHYKWRLMRANGIQEELISGNGNDKDKFFSFIKTMEKAYGNPVYEWSHLELKRYFNIDLTLNSKNCNSIWTKVNGCLKTKNFTPKNLIKKMNVKLIATTDDPISELKYHKLLKNEELTNGFKVTPTFRPDVVLSPDNQEYRYYIKKLEKSTNLSIENISDLEIAISKRVDYFHRNGCRLADHGLNDFYFRRGDTKRINKIFRNILDKKELSKEEIDIYRSYIQLFLMSLYSKNNWTMQIHVNVYRNTSEKHLLSIGIDSGFDSIGDQTNIVDNLKELFAEAEVNNTIPKTILYSLNPNDWMGLATLMGNFQTGMTQRIQLGCAWWFNDTYDGMRKQLTIFSQQSLLGNFVGMVTDSRSFLSYPRHEYFRRILCNLVGEWILNGRLPFEEDVIGKFIQDICFNNAKQYFDFN